MIKDLIHLMRVHQWVKNLMMFLPIFFAGELYDINKIQIILMAFLAFSLGSSAVYILNDIKDIESDKSHSEKSLRPLASGKVSTRIAVILMLIILVVSLFLAFNISHTLGWIITSYVILNIGYSFGLKRVSIIDIMIVALGFVLRVIAGGSVANVPLSQWLIVMTFLLALFLVLAKRRDDILVFKNSGKVLRESVRNYNLDFVNSVLSIISGVIIVSYMMYTISTEVTVRFNSSYLYLTSFFVIAGILRYLQIALVENKSGSPVRIFYSDKFLQITLILWLASFYLILYVLP